MEIQLSQELCSLIPHFKIGVIVYDHIQVQDSPQMLQGRLQLFQESIYIDLEGKNVTELEGIKEWREMFKRTGKDPNRYRHSAEALYRRVKKQNYLQPINSAIDLNSFFSLQYQIPLGIYDRDKLSNELIMRIGAKGEEYEGLNGRSNSIQNLIVTEDRQIGAFGSPFVDSNKAPVSMETKNAVHIVYLRPSINEEESKELLESIMNMFIQIHGGEGTYKLLTC
ncbi:B3/4 domain-containing protein [Bacillus sp. 03113]|uniref:B3/B4 domain-containing protein n=1 Tax=Bacillus sp. 03113 TaxID=2578211 RepID=UPI001141D8DB|nr:phenylalanine--tRNA ligase beta subunit-related protein [Bacillus sp. 03113]